MLINVFIENENWLLSTIILWIRNESQTNMKSFSLSWFAYLIQKLSYFQILLFFSKIIFNKVLQ